MQTDNPQGDWSYRTEEEPVSTNYAAPTPQPAASEPVTWTASEFIARHKSAGWYTTVIIGAALLCGVIYVLTRDLISVITISVVLVLFLILSARKPRQQVYSLDDQGVDIGDKFYPYDDFKSFAVSYEGAIGCVTFIPLKRFMPEISIYYAPDDEYRIMEILARSLPNDQRRERTVDRLIDRLHF